jgi:hypothetical protein
MLPASVGAAVAKVLVCVFFIMLFVKSPLGGAKKSGTGIIHIPSEKDV